MPTATPAPTETAADGTRDHPVHPAERSESALGLALRPVNHGATTETIVRPIPIAPRTLVVEFFPEGGDLVTGVPNRVYFRATTPAGKPADLDGYLTDGTRSITPVKTVTDPDHPGANQGLGEFTFTPGAGQAVRRQAAPADERRRVDRREGRDVLGGWAAAAAGVYPLPRAVANGVVMSIPDGVTDAGQPIRVTLRSNDRRDLYVGAYTRGVPVAAGKVTVEPGKPAELVLTPRAGAIGGVTRVTVFEEPDPTRGRTRPDAGRRAAGLPPPGGGAAARLHARPPGSTPPATPVNSPSPRRTRRASRRPRSCGSRSSTRAC